MIAAQIIAQHPMGPAMVDGTDVIGYIPIETPPGAIQRYAFFGVGIPDGKFTSVVHPAMLAKLVAHIEDSQIPVLDVSDAAVQNTDSPVCTLARKLDKAPLRVVEDDNVVAFPTDDEAEADE